MPTDFGVNYEDLNLHTPDGIVLRSYLLRQRKDLDNHHSGKLNVNDDETDEEVGRMTLSCMDAAVSLS